MRKKIYKGIIVLCSVLLASVIIVEGFIIVVGNKIETHQEVDYLIVLGAGLYWDVPSPSLTERLKVAHKYLEENKDMKVIVSGGQGLNEKFSEAYAMSEYLLERGIAKGRIILEDKSTNTFQNLSFSLDKIKEINNKDNPRVLIASNKYHIFRAKILANRLGMVPYGLPGKIPPTVVFKSYAREYFAVIKSLLFDKV
ncbi:MAG TPA: YdcF family protein [Epulopiscium sp.]|nr:YdcF family protein [Candidatus Epulonipiscium sp.]